jgi:hypothetical protein
LSGILQLLFPVLPQILQGLFFWYFFTLKKYSGVSGVKPRKEKGELQADIGSGGILNFSLQGC